MIQGTGIDIIEVDRVAAKITKENGFREMVFSSSEIIYCESKTHRFEHYAARFAAKEAFLKAAGTGWSNGISFNEIEISHEPDGRPIITLLGETARSLANLGIKTISVSLSHLKTVATAIVIIEN